MPVKGQWSKYQTLFFFKQGWLFSSNFDWEVCIKGSLAAHSQVLPSQFRGDHRYRTLLQFVAWQTVPIFPSRDVKSLTLLMFWFKGTCCWDAAATAGLGSLIFEVSMSFKLKIADHKTTFIWVHVLLYLKLRKHHHQHHHHSNCLEVIDPIIIDPNLKFIRFSPFYWAPLHHRRHGHRWRGRRGRGGGGGGHRDGGGCSGLGQLVEGTVAIEPGLDLKRTKAPQRSVPTVTW